jgi:hypothetical protein
MFLLNYSRLKIGLKNLNQTTAIFEGTEQKYSFLVRELFLRTGQDKSCNPKFFKF